MHRLFFTSRELYFVRFTWEKLKKQNLKSNGKRTNINVSEWASVCE